MTTWTFPPDLGSPRFWNFNQNSWGGYFALWSHHDSHVHCVSLGTQYISRYDDRRGGHGRQENRQHFEEGKSVLNRLECSGMHWHAQTSNKCLASLLHCMHCDCKDQGVERIAKCAYIGMLVASVLEPIHFGTVISWWGVTLGFWTLDILACFCVGYYAGDGTLVVSLQKIARQHLGSQRWTRWRLFYHKCLALPAGSRWWKCHLPIVTTKEKRYRNAGHLKILHLWN